MSIDGMKDHPEILEATIEQARRLMVPADRLAARVMQGEGPPHLVDAWKHRNVMSTTSEAPGDDGTESTPDPEA